MITLFIWSLLNGFLFHLDAKLITDDMRMLITIIGLASDLNMLATCTVIEILCNLQKTIMVDEGNKNEQ